MLVHEGVLYSDILAKYAAAFFRMSRSLVVRFNSAFMRLSSVLSASTSSLVADGDGCWLFFSQTYKLLSDMPSRFATSTTPCPRSVTCLTASALNSAVYLALLIGFTPVQFLQHNVSTEADEVHLLSMTFRYDSFKKARLCYFYLRKRNWMGCSNKPFELLAFLLMWMDNHS